MLGTGLDNDVVADDDDDHHIAFQGRIFQFPAVRFGGLEDREKSGRIVLTILTSIRKFLVPYALPSFASTTGISSSSVVPGMTSMDMTNSWAHQNLRAQNPNP